MVLTYAKLTSVFTGVVPVLSSLQLTKETASANDKVLNKIFMIDSFGKTQNYKDGRQKICNNCVQNPSGKLQEIQKKKEKLEQLRQKLDN